MPDQINSEYRIPIFDQEDTSLSEQKTDVSAIDKTELNAIYQNLGSIGLSSNPNKIERICEISERLYSIAHELDEARSIQIEVSEDKDA